MVEEEEELKPEGAPDKVRVAALDYRIDWVDSTWSFGTDRYGECAYSILTIRLNGQLLASQLARDFMHEVQHAGWDAMGCPGDSDPGFDRECVAEFSGNFWPMFWRDNPAAMKWWLSLLASDD